MDSLLLQLSILIPLAVAVMLLLFGKISENLSKVLAFVGFAAPLCIAIKLAIAWGCSVDANGYAFFSSYSLGLEKVGIKLSLGLNGIGLPLYVMSAIVGLAAGWYALQSSAERKIDYLTLLLVMFGGLMGIFASVDIFFFYFFHELALIPTFIMIGVWGGRSRRSAAMQMTVYLTLGAMLSLAGLIGLYVKSGANGSFDLIYLRGVLSNSIGGSVDEQTIAALLLFGFGILVSLFPFHSWAPRGYASAPSSVAMLHAGVLKKFGLYGLIQIAYPLLPEGMGHWNDVLICLALCNILVIGFITIAQRDLKLMLGYSSVMHMGYAFLAIATVSTLGISGAVIMMFGHGLSIALLFLLATAIHHRTNTYDMKEMGGLAKHAPVLCGFFVAGTMASIGLPGFANFWGELTIFVSLWEMSPIVCALTVSGIVISAIYGLRSIARIFFGEESERFSEHLTMVPAKDIRWRERMPALILLIALFTVGFWPRLISDSLNKGVESVYGSTVASSTSQPATETNQPGK